MSRTLLLSGLLLGLAATSCEKTPDPARAQGLVDALVSTDPEVDRRDAAQKLAAMGEVAVPYLVQALQTGADLDFPWVETTLANLGPQAATAVHPLIAALEGGNLNSVRTLMAVKALANIGEPAVQPLATAAKADDPVVAAGALLALSFMDPAVDVGPAIPVVIELIAHEDHDVDGAASAVLTQHSKRAVPELISVIWIDRQRK